MEQKVLFISYDGLPYNKLRTNAFAQELLKEGVSTEVFSFRDNLHAPFHGPESYKTSAFARLSLLIKAFFFLVKQNRKTIFVVAKAGFHSLAPVLVSFIKGNKIVMDYDDYEYSENNVFRNLFFYLLLFRAKIITCSSVFLTEFMKEKIKKTVYHIPGCLDASLFSPMNISKEKLFTFVWLGNVSDQEVLKNLLFLIDCFVDVQKKNPKTILRLSLKGELSSKIEEDIKKRNAKNIEIVYQMDSLQNFYAKAHCGLFPLVTKNKYNAAKCPTKVEEYSFMKLPVICTGYGEVTKMVINKKTGLYADSKEDWVKAMLFLSLHKSKAEEFGKNGRKHMIQNYELKKQMKSFKKILENL